MKFIRKVGWRLYYSDPKAAETLVSLTPGQAPLTVATDKIATEDARETAAKYAAEARRVQREQQRARLASVEARQPTDARATKSSTTTTTVTKSVATEIFSRMER
jgi:hypothetical protein